MKKNGFSMIELLAVVFIIGLLSSIGIFNYQEIRGQLALNRAAHQLLQDLRKAQEMAMSASSLNSTDCVSRAPLHFASLSHIALGGIFEAYCSSEIIGNNDRIKFKVRSNLPLGHLSYFWLGYAGGCDDNPICEKEIIGSPPYDALVFITNEDNQTLIANCGDISIGVPAVNPGPIKTIHYYGIFISTLRETSYKLYADIDGLGYDYTNYPTTDCVLADINIAERGVIIKEIKNLTPGRLNTSIGFAPPNPNIYITGLDTDHHNSVEIVLALASDPENPAKQRTISVNTAGLLELK